MADGVYGAALTYMFGREWFDPRSALGADLAPPSAGPRQFYDSRPRRPHHAPRAKSVIHLFMNGGPSQVDLFDPKPVLDKHHGQPYFDKIAQDVSSPQAAGGLLRSPYKFSQHGQSGAVVSEVMPHLTRHVDDIRVTSTNLGVPMVVSSKNN